MQFSSDWSADATPSGPTASRRLGYRHAIQSLVYVTLDQGNGGIIRNLSQDGCAIQAVASLTADQTLRLRFELLNPKSRFDVRARVTWATATGQAGLRFQEMDPRSRRLLSDWLFTALLRLVEQQAAPVLEGQEGRDGLILPAPAHPAIRLPGVAPPQVGAPNDAVDAVALAWWPRPISSRTLAGLMDGLVLLSAVLMFFCGFLVVTRSMPTWPVVLALGFGVAGAFTVVYWFLFAVIGRGTAGVRLARIVMGESSSKINLREQEARFR